MPVLIHFSINSNDKGSVTGIIGSDRLASLLRSGLICLPDAIKLLLYMSSKTSNTIRFGSSRFVLNVRSPARHC